jgi:hypothetical protein
LLDRAFGLRRDFRSHDGSGRRVEFRRDPYSGRIIGATSTRHFPFLKWFLKNNTDSAFIRLFVVVAVDALRDSARSELAAATMRGCLTVGGGDLSATLFAPSFSPPTVEASMKCWTLGRTKKKHNQRAGKSAFPNSCAGRLAQSKCEPTRKRETQTTDDGKTLAWRI